MGLGADNNEQVDVNVLNLPYCTSNNSIAVGFQSDRDVIYLRKLLLEVMSKSRKELKEMLTDTVNTQTNDINKNNTRNYDRNDRNQRERDNKIFKQNERIAKSLEKDKEKGISKAAKSYIAAAIEFTLKAYNIALGPAMRLSNLFMDIESSGIFLKNGFDDLHESANRVGMSHEQMAALLKRTAPMLAKFNAAGKNGIQTLTKSMASIDSSLNLSNEEREAAVDATMNYIPAVRLANMSQQELNTRVNETARQLKMLAMATGKTIEQIKEEQDIKAKALRVKAYARSHPNQYKAMQAAGMSDDMIDYVASGGLRVTPEIMMSMAGPQNQFWRDLTNSFINGNISDIKSLGNFINNNTNSLDTSLRYGERASSNKALYGVQSLSPLHENFAQGGGNYYDMEKLLSLGGIEGVLNNTSSGYNKSQKALERIYEAARNREKIGNSMEWLRGGGVEGVSQIAGIQASIYGTLNHLTDFLESFLGGTGLIGVITMAMSPFFARYIGDKILSGILGVSKLSPRNIARIANILTAGKGGLLAKTVAGGVSTGASGMLTAVPGILGAANIATLAFPMIQGAVEEIAKQVTGEDEEEKKEKGEDVYLGEKAYDYYQNILNGGTWNALTSTLKLGSEDFIRWINGEKTVLGSMRDNEIVRSYRDSAMADYGVNELQKEIEKKESLKQNIQDDIKRSEISTEMKQAGEEAIKALEGQIDELNTIMKQYVKEQKEIEDKKMTATYKQIEIAQQNRIDKKLEAKPATNNI